MDGGGGPNLWLHQLHIRRLLECHDNGNMLIVNIVLYHRPLYLYDSKYNLLWPLVPGILDFFHYKPVQKYSLIHLSR